MEKPLISVIMSTYNESKYEIKNCIESVLYQSYSNFEFIIINDNPKDETLKKVLDEYTDSRIRVYCNKENVGLVKSLNYALSIARGLFIVRMDADDISKRSRIEDEFNYLVKNNLDIVGTCIELIDENDNVIQSEMRLPQNNSKIKLFMRWGSCIAHPTWMVRTEVYKNLNGYRNIPYCEDYDFILRAIKSGYKLGNVPKVELSYRVRNNGISGSNKEEQFLIRNYLAKNMKKINVITEDDVDSYIISNTFQLRKNRLFNYKCLKEKYKSSRNIKYIILIMLNKCFWRDLIEKATLKLRQMV